jgi:hypothetical protein
VPRTAIVVAFGLLLAGVASIWRGGPAESSEEALARKATHYTVEGNAPAAVQAARQALVLSPASAYRWCDLAEALLAAGERDRAASCFRRAVQLAPATPTVLLRAVYGATRLGDTKETLALGRRVLELVPDYDDVVYGVYLSSGIPIGEILQEAVPERAAPGLFRCLLETGEAEPVSSAWNWLRSRRMADDSLAAAYVDALWTAGQFERARGVWHEHRDAPVRANEFIWDGGFDLAAAGQSKFDWTVRAPRGARIARECTQGSGCALRMDFSRSGNELFEHVEQTVPLPQGRYRLTARIRTDRLTTDAGFGIRALAAGLDARSPQVTGTSIGWQTMVVEFNRPIDSPTIRVQLFRLPTWKQDNELSGIVWVDAVSLVRLI